MNKSTLPRKALMMALGLLLPVAAPAASLTIDGVFLINDLTSPVSITDITPGGPTGRLTACTPSGESCFFSIASSQGVLPTFFAGLEMLEPGTLTVSDTLVQTDTGGTSTFWSFVSDNETTDTPLSALSGTPATIVENGTQQLVATLVYGTTGHADEIFAQSDVDTVPEPSSGVLALIGMGALGLVMLRRRFAARAV
jgi:hypothetical protein